MGYIWIETIQKLPYRASDGMMQKAGMKYESTLRGRLFSKGQFQDVKQYAAIKEDYLIGWGYQNEDLSGGCVYGCNI